jgi:hypothetical protein
MAKARAKSEPRTEVLALEAHVDALESLYRGKETAEAVARDLAISPRLARAILEDLRQWGYAVGV